jgi:hypothetical protein
MSLTPDEVKHIASESARQAVAEILLALGVKTNDQDDFIEMQKDFAHVRAWRQSVETIRTRGLIAATGIIVTGVMGAVWMGIKGSH